MTALAVEVQPFTLTHFEQWVEDNELTLEDESDWLLEDFQRVIITDLIARSEGNTPLFREVWALLPEGNAKTTLFAGAAFYLADHSPSPWIPIGAASRDQAEILFGQAGGFVDRSGPLGKRFRVYDGYRKIKCHTGGRGIKVYAADAGTGDGVIPFPIALVDEPHRHKDMSLYRLWKGKANKRGASIAALSTAGEPGSEFETMRETIRAQATERVRDGEHGCHLRATGSRLVYHEWQVPKVEQARDLDVVKEANPLDTITVEYLGEKLESPTLDFGNDWLRLTCNIPTRSSQAAVPEADWDACATATVIPEGQPVMVGADFAFVEDTTAIIPLWVPEPSRRVFGHPYVIEPPNDGTMLDTGDIKFAFAEIHERNPIAVVVMDVSKAQDIGQWLEEEFGCLVIAWSQKNEQAATDYERFMQGVRERWIHHDGDPTFRVHVLSAIRRVCRGTGTGSTGRGRFGRRRTGGAS